MTVKIIKYNGIDHAVTKCHDSKSAKAQSKIDFEYVCCISGMYTKTNLVGGHCYSAGIFPTLAAFPINVFPMLAKYHMNGDDTLDHYLDIDGIRKERPVENTGKVLGRINWLLEHAGEDKKGFVRHRLEFLNILALDLGCYRGGFVK